jgi:hypothetical protein
MKTTLLEMIGGHVLFIVSGVLYTVHWYLLYRKPEAFTPVFMTGTLIAGLAAVVLMALGLEQGGREPGGAGPLWPVPAACAAAFLAVFVATSVIGRRPFTSELPLLLVWAGLEAAVLVIAARLGLLAGLPLTVGAACNALAAVAGLVCYGLYYNLEGDAQFMDGLIPYFAICLSSGVTVLFLALSRGAAR